MNFKLTHIKDVVETIDPVLQSNQILLEQAKKHDAEASIGSQIHIELPAVSFGRVTANMARQVIYTRVREAEKKRQELENSTITDQLLKLKAIELSAEALKSNSKIIVTDGKTPIVLGGNGISLSDFEK